MIEEAVDVFNAIRRVPFSKKADREVRTFLQRLDARTCADAIKSMADYEGPRLSGKTHEHLAEMGSNFICTGEVWEAISAIADGFDGLRFDFEKAEDDVWYTDPPLQQLADMAHEQQMNVDDLIDRLERARDQLRHYQGFEDDSADGGDDAERPLHLMTATRAKGKNSTPSSCSTRSRQSGLTGAHTPSEKSRLSDGSSTSPSHGRDSA